MWQRKQTIFLLLAVILGAVVLCAGRYNWVLMLILCSASALDLYSVFLYKQRMRQAMLCMIAVLCYVAWYIALIVYSKQVAPDASQFELVWSDILPAVCAILVFMARSGIMADEKLVRAADRIR